METNVLVTPRELAAILKVPVSWLYRRTSQGSIPHVKLGHYVRFNVQEVLAHFQAQAGGKPADDRV